MNGRRVRPALVAAIAMVATGLAVPAHSGAALAAPPATSDPASTGMMIPGLKDGVHRVTLVTGDQVTVRGSAGRFSIEIQAAARSDGQQVSFTERASREGVFVIPSDAVPALDAGRLDRQLFDVERLLADGYDDEETDRLPLIVQYGGGLSRSAVAQRAQDLAASTAGPDLPTIHGAAVSVEKENAAGFWDSIVAEDGQGGARTASLTGGLSKVWLDDKVSATLDQSVPLIGAPQAWHTGHDGTGVTVAVLDTGVDAAHPDLAGKIVESKSFVPGVDSVRDGQGHGTHVAATVAGSGAASGGSRKGVAPGAHLAIGKVLADDGSGLSSWILQGMEWAAHSGATVVSMSLGGGPTDGTDPLSMAVDRLTAETGTLFVIAAGNAGPGASSVGAPGAASSALTVAATDKTDKLADFSSRGPRLDGVLKPDIAAPGVHIGAARAAGTSLCQRQNECIHPGDGPIDEHYTAASGTSMATPHVAGAAAIVAQQHPDWSPERIKADLMSTAKDDGYTVYEQGAGRVDVARADRQQVAAATPSADFGSVTPGQSPGPLTKQIRYANEGDQQVTLTLTATLRTVKDEAVPAGTLTADGSVTVPAGGTVEATITLNPDQLEAGMYTGSITAVDAAGTIQLTTPVGVATLVTIDVKTLDRHGNPVNASPGKTGVVAVDLPGLVSPRNVGRPAPGVLRYVGPPATYSIEQAVRWRGDDDHPEAGVFTNPEVKVDRDTEVVLDGRKAVPVRITTPQPATVYVGSWVYERSTADLRFYSGEIGPGAMPKNGRFYLTPTQRVTKGVFRFASKWTLGKAPVTMTVVRPQRRELHPLLDSYSAAQVGLSAGFVPWRGEHTYPISYVGLARSDQSDFDVKGKLALLAVDPNEPPDPGHSSGCHVWTDRVKRLREAGAVGVIAFPVSTVGCAVPLQVFPSPSGGNDVELPTASVTTAEGTRLRDMVAEGAVSVRVTGTPDTPYTYWLRPAHDGQIPGRLDYTFTDQNLARLDATFHASQPTGLAETWGAFKPNQQIDFSTPLSFQGPRARTEYFGPVSSDVFYRGDVDACGDLRCRPTGDTSIHVHKYAVFDRPGRSPMHWSNLKFAPAPYPVPPQPVTGVLCMLCRQGDVLYPQVETNFPQDGTNAIDLHLFRDGTEIPAIPDAMGIPRFVLPKEPAAYRMVQTSPGAQTTWAFASARPAQQTVKPEYGVCVGMLWVGLADPCSPEKLIFLRYNIDTSLLSDDSVAAPGKGTIRITAGNPQSVKPMPPIRSLKAWLSVDSGKSWTHLRVKHHGDGVFDASVAYPKVSQTSGAVSLKVEASDALGGTVQQTIVDAYRLTAR
jgi:subtilisin family serine protease